MVISIYRTSHFLFIAKYIQILHVWGECLRSSGNVA